MLDWQKHKGLVLSLVGNVLLAGALAWGYVARHSAAPSTISLLPRSSQSGVAVNAAADQPWQQIRANDYAAYAKNLRTLGFPQDSVADLIVGEVTTQFSERWRSEARVAAYRYWETASTASAAEQARLRELRTSLARERRELLLKILGPQAWPAMTKYQPWNAADPDTEALAFLPVSKREQLFAITQKYLASAPAEMASATAEELRRAAAEQARQRQEIAALLSARELEELDLRQSETAQRLRRELNGFAASETEFRQLFRVRRAYEATLAANADVRDPNVLQVRIEAERRFAEESRAVLGEQRYTDYQRARDPDYQNALQLAQFYSLPGEVAARVYELKRDVEARASAITANTALSEARRSELLGQIQTDTERNLQSWFGGEVLAEYRRNNRWWIWND